MPRKPSETAGVPPPGPRVLARNSRNTLRIGSAANFPGDTLFERIARGVCQAQCLPRKELYESWEVARRVSRRLRGGRIVDLAAGHGLVGLMMSFLYPDAEVVCVDRRIPPSAGRLLAALAETWPHLPDRIRHVACRVQKFEVLPGDIVVSAHACGALTDLVLESAVAARAHVGVLPCCHSHHRLEQRGLTGWLGGSVAIDVVRAIRLEEAGYRIWTQRIPEDITPENRLLLGIPLDPPSAD